MKLLDGLRDWWTGPVMGLGEFHDTAANRRVIEQLGGHEPIANGEPEAQNPPTGGSNVIPPNYHGRQPGYCGNCGQQTLRRQKHVPRIVCDWCGWTIHTKTIERLGGRSDGIDWRDRALTVAKGTAPEIPQLSGYGFWFDGVKLQVVSILSRTLSNDVTSVSDPVRRYEPMGVELTLELVGCPPIDVGQRGTLQVVNGQSDYKSYALFVCVSKDVTGSVDNLVHSTIRLEGTAFDLPDFERNDNDGKGHRRRATLG